VNLPMKEAVLDTGAVAAIRGLMAGFTVETTPGAAAKIADYRVHLRPGTRVYVTFLPGSDFDKSIDVAARLRAEGFEPVPHIAARSIPSRAFLEQKLARLRDEAAIAEVLVIAGSVAHPLGPFADTMAVLETDLLEAHGIRRIGVAGHPEGSPDIPAHAVLDAILWKNAYAARSEAALYIVTQFCFQAEAVIEWAERLAAAGNRLPIRIGVPGPATLKTLLNHARACGVGPSMRFLSRQARNLARLMTVSAPDGLIASLAAHRAAHPDRGIEGLHVYPFGGLGKTARWSYAVLDGHLAMRADDSGFTVDVDPG